MKNQITSKILKFTFAFMFVLLASSCSDDNDAMDAAVLAKENAGSEVLAKGAKPDFTATVYVPGPIGEFSYSSTTVCLGDNLTVSFDNLYGATNDCGEIQIQYSMDGGTTWEQLDKGTAENGVFSGTLVNPEAGTYSFRADFAGNAGGCKDGFDNLKFQDNTVLAVVVVDEVYCSSCDDASFSVVATNDNLDLLFTYDAAVELISATVEFTFPQVMNLPLNDAGNYIASDDKEYSVNNPTNQTVFTWIGNIGCTNAEAETFSFSHLPDCGAGNANDGEAVIWADMKVNGTSVKNGMPSIKYLLCPVTVRD